MSDLSTTYMGIKLKNPLVVAASSVSNYVDRVKRAEEAGASALVIRSLFEEQILQEQLQMDEQLSEHAEAFAEATSYFPTVEHGGPSEHLMWVEKTRKAVSIPVFASLNAVAPGSWVSYAKQLEETGVDGLELNYYTVPTQLDKPGSAIEQTLYEIVEAVQAEINIPVAVKLSPFFTNAVNVVAELEKRGVQAAVLFNRFLQPDIDPVNEALVNEMILSHSYELKVPLRWIALLYGRANIDLALSTGAHTGLDVIKGVLAGASVVQVASTLLRNGIPYLSTMLIHIESWMQEKGYEALAEFQGKLSQKNCDDPLAFERAQYIKLLLDQSRT